MQARSQPEPQVHKHSAHELIRDGVSIDVRAIEVNVNTIDFGDGTGYIGGVKGSSKEEKQSLLGAPTGGEKKSRMDYPELRTPLTESVVFGLLGRRSHRGGVLAAAYSLPNSTRPVSTELWGHAIGYNRYEQSCTEESK